MQVNKKLEYRLYGLVLYNISPIQQGIQFGHAAIEYAQNHFKDEDYQLWAKKWKTFIILNGGTSNRSNDEVKMGTMEKHLKTILLDLKLKYASFYEPDLNNALTSIVFLVDERVFNYKKYPTYEYVVKNTIENFILSREEYYLNLFGDDTTKILKLREFLSQFKLA